MDQDRGVDEGVTPIPLTGPLMLLGAGMILTFLGATCMVLNFTNASITDDANIKIVAIRAALESGT